MAVAAAGAHHLTRHQASTAAHVLAAVQDRTGGYQSSQSGQTLAWGRAWWTRMPVISLACQLHWQWWSHALAAALVDVPRVTCCIHVRHSLGQQAAVLHAQTAKDTRTLQSQVKQWASLPLRHRSPPQRTKQRRHVVCSAPSLRGCALTRHSTWCCLSWRLVRPALPLHCLLHCVAGLTE